MSSSRTRQGMQDVSMEQKRGLNGRGSTCRGCPPSPACGSRAEEGQPVLSTGLCPHASTGRWRLVTEKAQYRGLNSFSCLYI